MGVWIETAKANDMRAAGLSHPSWVCGLKQLTDFGTIDTAGHTLRGCVD